MNSDILGLMLAILFILPLLILPFFDQTVEELPFVYFLTSGLLIPFLIRPLLISESKKVPRIIILFWILFLLRTLVSAVFSVALPYSVIGLVYYVAGFTWFLIGLFLGDKDRLGGIGIALISTAVLLSIANALILTNVFPKPAGSLNLLTYTFGHNRIAGFLVLAVPLIITALFERKWSVLPAVSLVISLPLLILSGARAALAGLMVSLWYLWKMNKPEDDGWLKIIGISGLIVLSAALTIPVVSRTLPNSVFTKIISVNPDIKSVLFKPLAMDARLSYWSQAARAVLADPEGRGTGTARLTMLKFRRPEELVSGFTHNHYLQLAMEVGLSGALLFLILVGLTLWRVHQRIKSSQSFIIKGLGVGLFAGAFTSFFDFDWYFPGIFLLFWFIAGFVLGATADGDQQSHDVLDVRILRIFLVATGIYGVVVVSGLALISGSVLPPDFSRLHPILEKKSFDNAQRKMAAGEFGKFIDNNMEIYRFDNLMLAKVLQWQQNFGTKQQEIETATQMLNNDPLDRQALRVLQEAAVSASNP